MNVLIIDDMASSRMVLRAVLERIDMRLLLHEFEDPEAALEWSATLRPDFVLLDYRMPKMDGIEFARRFRQEPKHLDVPIVLVTVDPDEGLRTAARAAGVMDVVLKPFLPRDLQMRCLNLMNLRMNTELKRQDLSRQHRTLAAWIEAQMKDGKLVDPGKDKPD